MATRQTSPYLLFTRPRVFAALCIVLVMWGAWDLASGVLMIREHGLHMELNPIARTLYAQAGPLALTIAKLGTLLFGVCAYWKLAFEYSRPRLARSLLLVSIMLMVLGVCSNVV